MLRKFSLKHRWLGLGLAVLLVLAPGARAGAQTLAEDIQELVLDYQKLAELKQMLQNMYTAYGEIRQGYEQVKSIAAGNFNLHKAFLDALLAVSPVVRDYVKVSSIINNEAELVKEYQAARGWMGAMVAGVEGYQCERTVSLFFDGALYGFPEEGC